MILVESHGRLVGLVSAKDVLRFSLYHEEATHGSAPAGSELDDLLEEAGMLMRDVCVNSSVSLASRGLMLLLTDGARWFDGSEGLVTMLEG